MNIETLQYFLYTAKYNNITNAAKHLYVSQSTLSRHIMALENELGVKLFERNNKQLELTEAGKTFYKDSGSFINHMEAVINNVQSADKGHSGILRLTLPSQLYGILSEPLSIMRKKHPGIRLILESYMFDEIPSAIQYDLYNIGLTYDFALPAQENIDNISVGTDDFSLVVPLNYFAAQEQATIASLVKSLPLILPSHMEPPFLKKLLSVFQNYADAKIINTIYVNTSESVILNVSLGLGYSIIPSSWAKSHYGNKDVIYVDLPALPTKCSIVMLYKQSRASELTNNFINIIKMLHEEKP